MNRKNQTLFSLKGLLYLCLLIASGFFLWEGGKDIHTFVTLQMSIQDNETRASEVQKQKEELETTRQNLTNPDYVEQKVVRGKYLVTREGEQIFKFPAMDKNEQE